MWWLPRRLIGRARRSATKRTSGGWAISRSFRREYTSNRFVNLQATQCYGQLTFTLPDPIQTNLELGQETLVQKQPLNL